MDSDRVAVAQRKQKRPFECGFCPKRFRLKVTCKVHERVHTGEKPFKCEICSKSFAQLSTLTYHKRIHSGEKPYQCRICLKRFRQLSQVNQHERGVHATSKPFECHFCDKAFTLKSLLNQHLRVHQRRLEREHVREAQKMLISPKKEFKYEVDKKRRRSSAEVLGTYHYSPYPYSYDYGYSSYYAPTYYSQQPPPPPPGSPPNSAYGGNSSYYMNSFYSVGGGAYSQYSESQPQNGTPVAQAQVMGVASPTGGYGTYTDTQYGASPYVAYGGTDVPPPPPLPVEKAESPPPPPPVDPMIKQQGIIPGNSSNSTRNDIHSSAPGLSSEHVPRAPPNGDDGEPGEIPTTPRINDPVEDSSPPDGPIPRAPPVVNGTANALLDSLPEPLPAAMPVGIEDPNGDGMESPPPPPMSNGLSSAYQRHDNTIIKSQEG